MVFLFTFLLRFRTLSDSPPLGLDLVILSFLYLICYLDILLISSFFFFFLFLFLTGERAGGWGLIGIGGVRESGTLTHLIITGGS